MPKSSSTQSFTQSVKNSYRARKGAVHHARTAYLSRRPHRSFRMSRRRDYARSLKLPGYWALTGEVWQILFRHRATFLWLAAVYAVLTAAFIGFGSQAVYQELVGTLQESGQNIFAGDWGQLEQAGVLFASLATSGLTGSLTGEQQIYSILFALLVWMTVIWLLRHLLAGHKVRLRDGLYSAGAPLIPTFLVSLLFAVQLLPLAIAAIAYSSASGTGLTDSGIEAMLFWAAAGLLTCLTLYWTIASFFAMIIVTLPGTYPWQAIRTAGDIVTGRRVRILLRVAWMILLVALTWALVLIPLILLDGWVSSFWSFFEHIPLIPVALLALGVCTMIWSATYIYLLYRKVIDDDAAPA